MEREDARRMRRLSSPSRRLALLAPSPYAARMFFNRVQVDSKRSDALLAEMQRLRGSIYLRDGAIELRDLTNGRHQLVTDEGSWHLLLLDKQEQVCGCA